LSLADKWAMMKSAVLAIAYILFNMVSAIGIVFANKAVFAVYNFPNPVLLTFIHIAFTAVGMHLMGMVRLLCFALS
jgi:hypothetical protein